MTRESKLVIRQELQALDADLGAVREAISTGDLVAVSAALDELMSRAKDLSRATHRMANGLDTEEAAQLWRPEAA